MPTLREQMETSARAWKSDFDAYSERVAEGKIAPTEDVGRMSIHAAKMAGYIRAMSQPAPDQGTRNMLEGIGASGSGLMEPTQDGHIPSSSAPPVGAGSSGRRDSGVTSLAFGSEAMKALQAGALDRRITKASITSTTAPMAGIPQYDTSVFPYLRDRQRLLDLIPTKPTEAPAIHYFSGTTAASAAAAVAQGAAKPESSPVWTEVTAPVQKLAHFTRVNDEVIADFDNFLQVVGSELLAGLIKEETAQLLTGSGIGANLTGLLTTSGILTVGSAGTDLDAIAAGFLAIRTGAAHCDPDVVVMNPADWFSAGFLLAKDTAGQYLVGDPVTGVKPSLWGVPVILSEAMTENTALVANLAIAATAYVRQSPVVEVAPYGGGTTEFIANQTLIRAEERLALAVHHPAAICTVTAV
jgi:HK97 family phage major capsid protein